MSWKDTGQARKIKYIHTKAAVLIKGIAAFFRSTYFYVIASISILCNTVPHCRTAYFVEPCGFLFARKPDKPPPYRDVHIPQAWQCYIAKYP